MSETRDGNVARRLLVVGAHSGDFVWRSAGAVAAATSGGGEAKVVALSYGERGSPETSGTSQARRSRTSRRCATRSLRQRRRRSERSSFAWTSATTL
jgi:LmbE family N-acetylglucosaminyl deacetylase